MEILREANMSNPHEELGAMRQAVIIASARLKSITNSLKEEGDPRLLECANERIWQLEQAMKEVKVTMENLDRVLVSYGHEIPKPNLY